MGKDRDQLFCADHRVFYVQVEYHGEKVCKAVVGSLVLQAGDQLDLLDHRNGGIFLERASLYVPGCKEYRRRVYKCLLDVLFVYSVYQFTDNSDNKEDVILTIEADAVIQGKDIIVDGQYVDELHDFTLKWRGSSNQRVIDVKESLKENKVVTIA